MSVAAVASNSIYGQTLFGASSNNDASAELSYGIQTKVAALLNTTDKPSGASTAGSTLFPALGGHGLAGSVMLTFARMGYTLPTNSTNLTHTASASAAPSSSGGVDSFTVAKDMRAFLQALFAAVNGSANNDTGAAKSAGNGNGQSATSGFTSALQSLASGASGGSSGDSSGLSSYDQLQAAFQKLLSDMPNGPATAGGGGATLPSFLQSLAGALSSASNGVVGSLVDATV